MLTRGVDQADVAWVLEASRQTTSSWSKKLAEDPQAWRRKLPVWCFARFKESRDPKFAESFMHYDLGYIKPQPKTLQPLDNPFGTWLSTIY